MKRLLTFSLLLLAVSGSAQSQQPDEFEQAEPSNFPFQLRGYCVAGSIEDKEAPGGFYASPNMPNMLGKDDFAIQAVFLRALPEKSTAFAENYDGMTLQLINGTPHRQTFSASDSRIAIVQEALDAEGGWRPIEYLPSSWCGNSYHRVFLGPRQYWEFSAPRYSGSQETKLRFSLRLDDGTTIVSNEFRGSINPEQFTLKEGHTPTDIMDPYVD